MKKVELPTTSRLTKDERTWILSPQEVAKINKRMGEIGTKKRKSGEKLSKRVGKPVKTR